jgi:ribosomal protein L7/L12/outer membrane protein assembly factor BamB
MLQVIKCPSCAAPLECDGDLFEKCDFCGSQIAVNQNNIFSENSFGFNGLLEQAHKLKDILRLARGGNKIEAIRIYRETFKCSLAEAKDAVDRLASGQSVQFQNIRFQSAGSSELHEIMRLARTGNKIKAVQMYHQIYGGSLRDAKDAVDRLEHGQGTVLNAPEIAKTALKAVGIFSGSMVVLSGFIIALVMLVVGGVLWFVVSRAENAGQTTPAPVIAPVKTTEIAKSSYAREVLRFGGEGTGAGKFTDNRVVAVDGTGKIYSADYQGGRVQVFDQDGKFLTQWFVEKKEQPMYSLAASRKGTIYISQPGKITAFEGSTGKPLGEVKADFMADLAVTPEGKVVAADRDSLVVFDENLKNLAAHKNAAKEAGISSGFSSVAVNGLGEIFALSRNGKDLCKFSADGKFLDRFKVNSTSAHDLAIDSKGRIFISESGKVRVYQPDGNPVDSFETNQCFGLAFNDQGELLTASRPFVVKYAIGR